MRSSAYRSVRVTLARARYWPAGHTVWADEATAFLEIGPAAEMRQFGDHAKAKLG